MPQQVAVTSPTPVAVQQNDAPRIVAFIILLVGLACAGLAYLSPGRAEEGTVGLGRFRRLEPTAVPAAPTTPVHGGLGRFATTRTGPPPALS